MNSARVAVTNGKVLYDGESLAVWASRLADRIVERCGASRVVLYGSVARDDDGPDSDIDLLLVMPIVGRRHDAAVRELNELRDVPVPVDIAVVDPAHLDDEANVPDAAPLPGIDEERDAQINAFDWVSAFPAVFAAGGFDAVIGNPPYLNVDDTWGRKDARLGYLKTRYAHVYNDKTDLLFYFLAKAVEIAREDVCFIVSRAFLEAYKADKLRSFLAETAKVREIIDLRNVYVFDGVGITTAIVHLTKGRTTTRAALVRRLRADSLPLGVRAESLDDGSLFETVVVPHERFGQQPWQFANNSVQGILDRIDVAGEPLGEVLHVGKGMETGKNNVFGRRTWAEVSHWKVPQSLLFTRARNSDIQRFVIKDSEEMLLYTEAAKSFASLPDGVQEHLKGHQAELKARAAFKRGNCEWWKWTWPLHKQFIDRDKLYCPYLATENRFALDTERRFLGLTDTTVLYANDQPEDLRYLLGLLNSRVLTFRFRYIGKLKSVGILEYFWNSISKLPIRRIDPADERHARMVSLVQTMIDTEAQLSVPTSPAQKTQLRRRLATVDGQIELLVQELYGLGPADVAVIDETLRSMAESSIAAALDAAEAVSIED